jgi:hypothetical protein
LLSGRAYGVEMWFHTLSLEPIFSFNIFHSIVVKLNNRHSEKKKNRKRKGKVNYWNTEWENASN